MRCDTAASTGVDVDLQISHRYIEEKMLFGDVQTSGGTCMNVSTVVFLTVSSCRLFQAEIVFTKNKCLNSNCCICSDVAELI